LAQLTTLVRLIKQNRNAEALAVISALENKSPGDAEVQRTYHAIREAVAIEDFGSSSGLGDKRKRSPVRRLLVGGRSQNFRRASLGVINQCFQQITGINLIT